MYLNDEDQRVVYEIFHEVEHDFRPCYYALRDRTEQCSMFQRAVTNADRGALVVLDNLIHAKVDERREQAYQEMMGEE